VRLYSARGEWEGGREDPAGCAENCREIRVLEGTVDVGHRILAFIQCLRLRAQTSFPEMLVNDFIARIIADLLFSRFCPFQC
jgi:hypothetical protein